jgi:hypothetical protein
VAPKKTPKTARLEGTRRGGRDAPGWQRAPGSPPHPRTPRGRRGRRGALLATGGEHRRGRHRRRRPRRGGAHPPDGFFEARLPELPKAAGYRLRVTYADDTYDLWDPFAFWPTFGDDRPPPRRRGPPRGAVEPDGRDGDGGRRRLRHGVRGVGPQRRSVRVIGDFNSWDGRLHPMRMLGSSGVWEIFVPDVGSGHHVQVRDRHRRRARLVNRADPYAFYAEVPPGTASRIFDSTYEWGDADWFAERDQRNHVREPISVYEVHLGSWRRPTASRCPTATSPTSSATTAPSSGSPTWSCCPSPSTRSAAPGATRSAATTRRPRASATPTTSATSSTTSTSAASA